MNSKKTLFLSPMLFPSNALFIFFFKGQTSQKSCLYLPFSFLYSILIPQPTLICFLAPSSTKTLLLGSRVTSVWLKACGHLLFRPHVPYFSVFDSLNHSFLFEIFFFFNFMALYSPGIFSCFLGRFCSVPVADSTSYMNSNTEFFKVACSALSFSLC